MGLIKLNFIIFIVFIFLSCKNNKGQEEQTPDGIVEELLYGGKKTCVESANCLTNVCSFNLCMGFLTTPTFFQQDKAIQSILHKKKEKPEIEEIMIKNLDEILLQELMDPVFRSRAIYLLIKLNKEYGKKYYKNKIKFSEEIIRFRFALGLCEEKDLLGKKLISEFKRHPSKSVRKLAEICDNK